MQVCCPNGMDWDQDKNVFYFIDTADAVVRSYPVDENGVPKRSQDGVLLGVKDVSHAFSLVTVLAVHCHAADDPICILAVPNSIKLGLKSAHCKATCKSPDDIAVCTQV